MPKIIRDVLRPTHAEKTETLEDILWRAGDPSTVYCQRELRNAGLSPTAAELSRAEEANRERLRALFTAANNDPAVPLKIVVVGDAELDPAINPKHPVRGAAAVREAATVSAESDAVVQEDVEVEKVAVEKKVGEPRRKYDVLGFPVTSVLRWMGKEGWTIDQAAAVLTKLGCNCSPATVKIQVRAGAKGDTSEKGPPADLSPEQAQVLRGYLGETGV